MQEKESAQLFSQNEVGALLQDLIKRASGLSKIGITTITSKYFRYTSWFFWLGPEKFSRCFIGYFGFS
ncbi:hypothetical protein JTB14_018699 [Gonioctena quinquepunctata]|nr:hypothetical protein JTB14_018699 [Gonioctena quinquepunctata]